MALDRGYCYDSMADQLLHAGKAQVAMVRGLCASWKQPVYHDFDKCMTAETLRSIIVRLEGLGLRVVAAVSDMGIDNERMWKAAGVTPAQTWIRNPADGDR